MIIKIIYKNLEENTLPITKNKEHNVLTSVYYLHPNYVKDNNDITYFFNHLNKQSVLFYVFGWKNKEDLSQPLSNLISSITINHKPYNLSKTVSAFLNDLMFEKSLQFYNECKAFKVINKITNLKHLKPNNLIESIFIQKELKKNYNLLRKWL